MTIHSTTPPGRRWPAWALLIGGAAALVAAVVAGDAATTAAAVLLVLSLALLAMQDRRAGRGAEVAPHGMAAATAGAVAAGALLVYLAEYAVVAVALLAVAVVFGLLVALLAAAVAIMSITRPPAWMLEQDGRMVGVWRRMRLALRHGSQRLRQRPSRGPEAVYQRLHRDTRALLWRGGDGPATAFAHLDVALHPDTLRTLDAWMPIEDVAAELAHGYAAAHRAAARKTALVVVLVSSDPQVPPGVASVAGSFRESHRDAPQARAWATLAGPLDGRRGEQGQRLAPTASSQPRQATRLMPDEVVRAMPESTAVLPAGTDRTRIIPGGSGGSGGPTVAASPAPAAGNDPAPASTVAAETRAHPVTTAPPVLAVRRISPDEGALFGREYLLHPERSWVVGRGRGADIQFAEVQVSRRHLELLVHQGGWTIIDRSSLGTSLNGQPLTPGTPTQVRPGDVLELGGATDSGGRRVLLQLG